MGCVSIEGRRGAFERWKGRLIFGGAEQGGLGKTVAVGACQTSYDQEEATWLYSLEWCEIVEIVVVERVLTDMQHDILRMSVLVTQPPLGT